jgi:hypothetical protein
MKPKNFEDLIKDYSSEFKTEPERIRESNQFFTKNYLSDSKYSSFNLPFVPGMIYSFEYRTPSRISEKRKFIDRNPIFLFVNYIKVEGENILHGIDLSVIPSEIRQIVLGRIWNSFGDQIVKNSESQKFRSALPLTMENLDFLLKNTGYKKSVFRFKYKYFNNLKEIKSQDWVKIPFLELNAFEGLNSFEIYKEYRSKLK